MARVKKLSNKQQVIDEAQREGTTVHLATVMDLCHLKNSELEKKFQKDKGRVVLRGDVVKDDSGSFAMFTEQGCSVSHLARFQCSGCDFQPSRMRRTSK